MSWFRDAVTGSNVVIAFATVVNLGVSAGLWLSTRESVDVARQVFEAANRPYVGLESVGIIDDADKKTLSLTGVVKNFGTVQAEKAEVKWELLLNRIVQPSEGVPSKPFTLFPGGKTHLAAQVGPYIYEQVMKGQTTLMFILRASYNGPGDKTYQYCVNERYDPNFNAFMDLGDCDEKHPARKG